MKFLVLDGNSILNRAFYGIRMLSNKKGQMTNGIYGFLSTLQKLLAEVAPDRIAVAFDLPAPTFRHKMYEGYKANRKKMPEELASQVPILKELLKALGYKLVMLEGYEADDVLGTFANYCEQSGYECVLATGDRDSLQLISQNVTVRIASTKFGKAESVFYDENKVKEVHGVSPKALIDVKALQGDSSDNIPGVKGVGEKTATELVAKFGGIDEIYNNIENLDIKESIKSKLKSGKDSAFMSYKLGKIDKNVPIDIKESDYIVKSPDAATAKKMLTELEFFSFIGKMNLKDVTASKEHVPAEICNDFKSFLGVAENAENISFLLDADNFTAKKFFVCMRSKIYIFDAGQDGFDKFVKDFMNIKFPEKITYDIKKLYRTLKKSDLSLYGKMFDVMLASYLLSPSSKDYDILKLADEYNIPCPEISSCKKIISDSDLQNAQNVYLISKLSGVLRSNLDERNQLELLFDIEQPLAEVLADMESEGFAVDKKGLQDYGKNLESQLDIAQKAIYEAAGFEFNINSPKQLGFVLFEKLGLPKGKKGKTGYSTSAATLEKLKGHHEIIDMILEYRALSKLKSTYCDGMIDLITEEGRIHSSFNQTETRTGRISSAEPNLQNIPVRTERGRELRKFFGAKEGCVLIDADYSQIELRVLAHISGDSNMINAFKNGDDIHTITALQIFNIPIEMITPEMRFRAKAVNFGIIYGMGAFSLSQDLKISRYEAQNYINRYLAHYKNVDEYMHRVIELAKKRGYAETMRGRRRYLPELDSPNHVLRSFGERVARNMPIQGTAADIIKIAMINTCKALKEKNFKSKLILQVHDELIIESPIKESDEVKALLKREMEHAVNMDVPLEVHISVGKTWYDAKE